MRLSIFLLALLWAGVAHGAVERVPIRSSVPLKPGEAQTITIEGQAVGEGDNIVLRSIDTCAPKAPNFGVPEKNVFR